MKTRFENFVEEIKSHCGFTAYVCLATLVLILVWLLYITPELKKIPEDFTYEAQIISRDNFYDETIGQYSGEILSNARFYYEVASVEEDALIIRNVFDVINPGGEPIFSTEHLYGIDALTGEHVPGYGDQDRTGYLFVPSNPDKQPFTYWHVNYNAPATMNFVSEEIILGLNTYHYTSIYTTDQTEDSDYLPGVPEERGISVETELSLWLEPETGHLIKYEDSSIAYYYDQTTGERIQPWNKFQNEYSSASIADHIELTQKIRFKGDLIRVTPWIIGLVALATLGAYAASRKKTGWVADAMPYLILIVSLSVTYFFWKEAEDIEKDHRAFHFESGVVSILDTVSDCLDIYAQALHGGTGLFSSSDYVTREEWRAYVSGLNLQKNYPGMQGVGYSIFIEAEDLNSHIEQLRAEGFPTYVVTPEGDRELYSSIVYLEPFEERNLRAFGYDMWSEPVRRSAMELARDTGEITISGKVRLMQEIETNVQAGFLMYSPVYKNETSIISVVEKREAILGYVYSPFRMDDFMSKTLPSEEFHIEYEIYDGNTSEDLTEENLMYDSNPEENSAPNFTTVSRMTLFGHNWMVRFKTLPEFSLSGTEEFLTDILLIGGIFTSTLLFIIVYSFANSRKRALTLAEQITKDLRTEQLGLAAASAKSEAILKSIGDGVVAVDEKNKILFVNKAATTMLMTIKEEMIGKDITKVINVFNAAGKKVSCLKGKNRSTIVHTSHFFQKKNGAKFPVAFTSSPITLEGKMIGMIDVFRDITKEKAIDKAKTEFVSLASHQLRTPLTTVKWYTEALLKGDFGRLSKHQTEQLKQVHQGNERMVELVNALLTVSRLELGTLSVEKKKLNIKKFILELIKDQVPQIKEKQIQLKTVLSKTYPSLHTDEDLLHMIIQNLISNAVKYTDDKGAITITLSAEEDSKELIFSVSDTGYGIPKDQQKKIFTKLFRADNAREKVTDGTGLGLYIVKNAAEKLGGKVWFESEENKGSTFFVSLPLKATA